MQANKVQITVYNVNKVMFKYLLFLILTYGIL